MKQSEIMMESEGDAWFGRNLENLGQTDPVAEAINSCGLLPRVVLEIGSANGWRLEKLRARYGCDVIGIEPSMNACQKARVPTYQATADGLPVESGMFDLVIYGFALYLADPCDWFKIVAEGDRVLRPGGHLIVHDFATAFPFARKYEHREGLMSYHINFSKLWLANPLYTLVTRHHPNFEESVTVLKKLPVDTIEVRP